MEWDAMLAQLELDGAVTMPLVDEVVADVAARVDWSSVRGVLDVGCGPGVITAALARHAPAAQVIALDASGPLLERVAARAADEGIADRVDTVQAQLDEPIPHLPEVDVVWASMVLHHVARPTAVLTDLHRLLRPGGVIVLVEFAGPPQVVPPGDPAADAWDRLQREVASARAHHLGLDPVTVDWPPLLHQAGFDDVTDMVRHAVHRAPLAATPRRWLASHLARNLEWVNERLDRDDVELLSSLAAQVPHRDDLFLRVERRLITAPSSH